LDNEDDRRSSRELVEQSVHETAMLQKAVPIGIRTQLFQSIPALGDPSPGVSARIANMRRMCGIAIGQTAAILGESGILRDKKQLDANTHQTLAKR
jgi:hypothetical protein